MQKVKKLIIINVWIVWGSIILLGSLLPAQHMPKFNLIDLFSIDKVLHFFCHGILTMLLLLGTKNKQQSILHNKQIWQLVIAVILYGILIELIQHFIIVNRQFDLLDIVANIAGCLVGMLLFNKFLNQMRLSPV